MEQRSPLSKDLVLLDVEVPDKWTLIEQMLDKLVESPVIQDQAGLTRGALSEALIAREKEKPTGLGQGFAFPHARIPGFEGLGLCVAFPKPAVDFDAPDGKPAELVCLMLVPEDQPQMALKIMSQFVRLASDPVDREILSSLKDTAVLSTFISRRVLGSDAAVTAGDIMREAFAVVRPDTPLKEVTRTMFAHRMDTIPVMEEDGILVGEITCDRLFKLGIPDFFGQLKSVAFISEFDPFEKYFEGERQTLARDVMSKDFCAVPETATLLEVVFELAVLRRPKVFVVRDGKHLGAIDRILVLDRVINI